MAYEQPNPGFEHEDNRDKPKTRDWWGMVRQLLDAQELRKSKSKSKKTEGIESDSPEPEAPKVNRARGLLNRLSDRLFPKVESVEDQTPRDHAPEEKLDHPEDFDGPRHPDELPIELPELRHDTDPVTQPEVPIDSSDIPTVAAGETVAEATAEPVLPPEPEIPAAMPSRVETPPPTPDRSELPEPRIMPIPEEEIRYEREVIAAHDAGSTVERSVSDPVTPTERIIERPVGAVYSFIAGEAFSRHRDKVLGENIKDVKHDQQELKKSFTTEKTWAAEQERKNAISRQELNNIHDSQRVNVHNQVSQVQRLERLEQQPSPASSPLSRPEIASTPIMERLVNDAEVAKVRPEVVMKKAEAAAENNVPLEGYYERRHELKDNPAADRPGITGSGAADVGAVLQGRSQQSDLTAANLQQAMRTNQASGSLLQNTAYKKAVTRGAWGAAVIVVVLGIIWLIG